MNSLVWERNEAKKKHVRTCKKKNSQRNGQNWSNNFQIQILFIVLIILYYQMQMQVTKFFALCFRLCCLLKMFACRLIICLFRNETLSIQGVEHRINVFIELNLTACAVCAAWRTNLLWIRLNCACSFDVLWMRFRMHEHTVNALPKSARVQDSDWEFPLSPIRIIFNDFNNLYQSVSPNINAHFFSYFKRLILVINEFLLRCCLSSLFSFCTHLLTSIEINSDDFMSAWKTDENKGRCIVTRVSALAYSFQMNNIYRQHLDLARNLYFLNYYDQFRVFEV